MQSPDSHFSSLSNGVLNSYHPTTITGILTAVTGGAVGGWISDIDCKDVKNEGVIGGLSATVATAGLSLALDFVLGNGICEYMTKTWSVEKLLFALAFLTLCIRGTTSSHRTYMHSLLGFASLTGLLYLICTPLAIPFGIGFASHLLLDLTNTKRLRLFYPKKLPAKTKDRKPGWTCDGDENRIIGDSATLVAAIMIGVLLLQSLMRDAQVVNLYEAAKQSSRYVDLNVFQVYLIGINVGSFFLAFIAYLIRSRRENFDSDKLFGHLMLFAILGGALGVLFAVLFSGRGLNKKNGKWVAALISLVIVWGTIYAIVCDPLYASDRDNILKLRFYLGMFAYLVVINTVSFIAFYKDKDTRRPHWKTAETILFLLGVIGGALGGYLVIIWTGRKAGSAHFAAGFPMLIAAHTVLIGYLISVGFAG